MNDSLRRVTGAAGNGLVEIEEGTRAQILTAAMHRFARAGYGKTSVKDIASDAGVTTGAIYHYFGSKPGLYREVGDRALENLLRASRTMTPPDFDQSQRERVEVLFETLSAQVYEHEDDHRMGVTLEIDALRHAVVAETRDEWAHHMEDVFHRAAMTELDLDDEGWDRDPLLVLISVLALGGICTVVRNGPAALQASTRALRRLLADPAAEPR
jgi:AcrR family transcriptional regulator